MTIALYARVSTLDKNQDTDLQLHDLKAYANARGWTETALYVDEGISGSKDSRPALNRLMDDCRKRKITHILVWKLDRFSRSLKHLLNTIEELEHLGVTLISFRENLDMGSPAGRLMTQMIGAFGEFERNIIKERVKAGIANAKRKGVKFGKVPKDFDLDLAQRLKGEGKPLRVIAHACGVSTMTVKRRL